MGNPAELPSPASNIILTGNLQIVQTIIESSRNNLRVAKDFEETRQKATQTILENLPSQVKMIELHGLYAARETGHQTWYTNQIVEYINSL